MISLIIETANFKTGNNGLKVTEADSHRKVF